MKQTCQAEFRRTADTQLPLSPTLRLDGVILVLVCDSTVECCKPWEATKTQGLDSLPRPHHLGVIDLLIATELISACRTGDTNVTNCSLTLSLTVVVSAMAYLALKHYGCIAAAYWNHHHYHYNHHRHHDTTTTSRTVTTG